MDALRHWLRSVVIIIIMGSFFEMILPGDDTRRFVRMVVNLLVVLALIGPLVPLVWREPEGPLLPGVALPRAEQTAELVTAGRELHMKTQNLFLLEGSERLAKRVADAAAMVPDVRDAEVRIHLNPDQTLARAEVRISCPASVYEDAARRIRMTVSALLDIPADSVVVLPVKMGGGNGDGGK